MAIFEGIIDLKEDYVFRYTCDLWNNLDDPNDYYTLRVHSLDYKGRELAEMAAEERYDDDWGSLPLDFNIYDPEGVFIGTYSVEVVDKPVFIATEK